MSKKCICLLVSDFNVDNLSAYLSNDAGLPAVAAVTAPFNQVIPVLRNNAAGCWRNADAAVVWTQPHKAAPSFGKILDFEKAPPEAILKEVDDFSTLIKNAVGRVGYIFVPTWVIPPYNRAWGMVDLKTGSGILNTLLRMNLRLIENLEDVAGIYLLDAQRWISVAGKDACNPKLWYMGKIAFSNEVFREAVKDIKAGLNAVAGNTKKLIIVDLDDTLWGGIVGDAGMEGIKLGGHDHIGEAFVDFQRALKALTRRGILLGIVSKNDEKTALATISKHPEMVLRLEDFAGWRINWEDKAENIVELVKELNLGLEAAVFIDDNPAERARVREALPSVYVPDWPGDKMIYKSALSGLSCFDKLSFTSEDSRRTQSYASERKRKQEKSAIPSLGQWLISLDTNIVVGGLSDIDLARATQLLNKTNQMNLTTRRMSEAQLKGWAAKPGHALWVFRVFDKFGDFGLVGIVSVEIKTKKAQIVDFVLSCRVFGRGVEEAMLAVACRYAKDSKPKEIFAGYIPTVKNKPCLDFFKKSGFNQKSKNYFFWDLAKNYKIPAYVKLKKAGKATQSN